MNNNREIRPKVLVLLSTYNGEKYLHELIESILCQDGVDVSILVRDDQSEDRTLDILKKYCEDHQNISIMDSAENLRSGNSFMRLLYRAGEDDYREYDYFAFADQDDIWLKNKLAAAIAKIEAAGPGDEAILYCSNQIIYKDQRECGLRFSEAPATDLVSVITGNKVSGCTFVLNHKLLRAICDAKHPSEELMLRRMHDVWIVLAALCLGKLIYDDKSYILYRIHDDNVVGLKHNTLSQQLKIYWKNLTDKKYGNYRSWTAGEAIEAFHGVTGKTREELEDLAFYRSDFRIKKRLMKNQEIMGKIDRNIVLAKAKVLLNLI